VNRRGPASFVLVGALTLTGVGCTSDSGAEVSGGTAQVSERTPRSTPSATSQRVNRSTKGNAGPRGDEGNPYEKRLTRLLSRSGVEHPGVTQHEFLGARVGGRWKGRWVEVHSYSQRVARTPGPVVDSVTIAGCPVQIVDTVAYGMITRFRCDGLGYDVASLSRPLGAGTSDRKAAEIFTGVLLDRMNCD